MSATVLTAADAEKAKIELITDEAKGLQAVHDVVVAIQAARRSGTACAKTKADVNLSGRKPWRQKGTGRARAGYFSSPVWVGGGVAHGPLPRDRVRRRRGRPVDALDLAGRGWGLEGGMSHEPFPP